MKHFNSEIYLTVIWHLKSHIFEVVEFYVSIISHCVDPWKTGNIYGNKSTSACQSTLLNSRHRKHVTEEKWINKIIVIYILELIFRYYLIGKNASALTLAMESEYLKFPPLVDCCSIMVTTCVIAATICGWHCCTSQSCFISTINRMPEVGLGRSD